MKLFFAEVNHQYQRYLFPYQVLLYKEKGDRLEMIYQAGFLPFRHQKDWFYLARSSRCRLADFSLSSENRRILKKTTSFYFKSFFSEKFDYSPLVQKRCKQWSRERGWQISTRSLKYLFSGQFFNQIWVWYDQEKGKEPVGYQVFYWGKEFAHGAHLFFHPDYQRRYLVIRMILESIIKAHKEKKKFYYLGTCYGKTGFYKRSFPGFEFFNGFNWSGNVKELEYFNQRQGDDYLFREEEYWLQFWQGKKKEEVLVAEGVRVAFINQEE